MLQLTQFRIRVTLFTGITFSFYLFTILTFRKIYLFQSTEAQIIKEKEYFSSIEGEYSFTFIVCE